MRRGARGASPGRQVALALCLAAPLAAQHDHLLGDLDSRDEASVAAAKANIAALPDAVRIRLLRAGLRSPLRPTAVWCASSLEWSHVDVEEARLLVEILRPELCKRRDQTPVSFDEFRYNLSSEELGPVLRDLAKAETTVEPKVGMFGHLHRQVRPVHLPLLAEIYVGADQGLASELMGTFTMCMTRTLRHKEEIGRAILQRRWDAVERTEANSFGLAPESTTWEPTEGKAGYSSLLHDLLGEFFRHERGEVRERWTRRWLFRWSLAEVPAADDRPLLAALLKSSHWLAHAVALHGLRAAGDPANRPLLEDWLERSEGRRETSPLLEALGLVALERSGREGLRAKLLELARRDAGALGILIGHDAESGRRILCEPLARPSPAAPFTGRLTTLGEYSDTGYEAFGGPIPDEFYVALEGPILAASMNAYELAGVCQLLPNPSKAMVLAVTARLTDKDGDFVPDLTRDFGDHRTKYLSLLEMTDTGILRRLLRASLAAGDESAFEPLLALAEEEDVAALIESIRKEPDSQAWPKLWFSNRSLVRDKIEAGCDQLDPDCMLALARIHGLPPEYDGDELAFCTLAPGSEDEARDAVRLIRAGKPIDGLLAWLNACKAADQWPLRRLGVLRDERIRAYLLEAREQRHLGLYWEATQELAHQGDAQARRAVDEVCRLGRYDWTEPGHLLPHVAIPTADRGWIRFWAFEVETNCCRGTTAWDHLENRLAWIDDVSNDGYRFGGETIDAYLRRCGNGLAWSKLVQKFVRVPRE